MKRLPLLALLFISQLHGRQSYRTEILTPRSVLGYELGDKYSSHGRIEKYLLALRDAAKDRVQLFPYGETYEGRTLYLAVFSSRENLDRLDEIKSSIRKLSDPRTVTDAEAERIIATMPAIAWLSYGVHGNEASA